MFIVWGTKIVERRLGRVAEFCPICRGFQPFRAVKLAKVGHLYYIPLGSGETVGFQKICGTCGIRFASPVEEFEAYSRQHTDGLDELIARTNPSIAAKWSTRLDWEARVRTGKLTDTERAALLREPFLLLNPRLDTEGSALERDRASGLGCLATLVIPGLVYLLATSLRNPTEEILTLTAVALAVALGLMTLYFLVTTGRRYTRRELIPLLARTLRPLNPTLEELETVLGELRQKGLKIARRVSPQRLYEALCLPQD